MFTMTYLKIYAVLRIPTTIPANVDVGRVAILLSVTRVEPRVSSQQISYSDFIGYVSPSIRDSKLVFRHSFPS
jgi:hypothetical protein